MILFFRQKIKDDFSQKLHGNMMFSVFSVKMVFVFPRNMILPFCHKKLIWSSPRKIHLKMTFPVSLKKMIFIPENIVFLLIEKLKMIKKFTFIKSFNDTLNFYGNLYRRFHLLLSNEKTQKTWYAALKFDFFFFFFFFL